ncbi:hypothetical protein RRG08_008418 [Elysia crispata]|uniref:Uncharacterized protein n=1 Tax=Elysia crispata TaxID=231223 RepID=A0AAE0ZHK9_9GAST|nr:hypothetical protein RRG08_008418 [Elysia crispata]
MSKTEAKNEESATVSEQLQSITELLKSFDERLRFVESTNIQSSPQTAQSPTTCTAEAGCAIPVNDGPAATRTCATDIIKEFEAIKDSVSKIVLPPYLKVSDSPTGVKQEHKNALKILSKSARFTETGLKLLSTFQKTGNLYHLTEDEVNALFVTLSASSHYLQSEYANIVVKSSFDDETSRLFCNLENNTAAFSDQSLRNIRTAAELAAVSNRSTARRSARFSYQHQGYRPHNNWRGRFFQNRVNFPRQPYNSSGYNNNSSGGFSGFSSTNRD